MFQKFLGSYLLSEFRFVAFKHCISAKIATRNMTKKFKRGLFDCKVEVYSIVKIVIVKFCIVNMVI